MADKERYHDAELKAYLCYQLATASIQFSGEQGRILAFLPDVQFQETTTQMAMF